MPDLTQPVAQILQEFGTAFLTPQLQPEVLQGDMNLPRLVFADWGPIYGAYFTALSIPPGLGRTAEGNPWYFEPLAVLSFNGPFASGAQYVVRRDELHLADTVLRFLNIDYTSIQIHTLPGVSFSFSYLKL